MKRRSVLKSLVAAPAIPAAAQSAPQAAAAPASEQFPKLAVSAPDAAVGGLPRFFTKQQFETLVKLGDTILPAFNGKPAASDTGAAEFIDFLVRESTPETQQLYRNGLDRLAKDGISDATLAPLRAPWTYEGPKDPFARFLLQAKADILQTAFNSREWSQAGARGRRGSTGMMNYYWRNSD